MAGVRSRPRAAMGLRRGGLFLAPFGSEGLRGAGSKKPEGVRTSRSIQLRRPQPQPLASPHGPGDGE